MPELALLLRVVLELLFVRPNPDEPLALEAYGLGVSAVDLQDDDANVVDDTFVKPKCDLWLERTREPVLEILIAALRPPRSRTRRD